MELNSLVRYLESVESPECDTSCLSVPDPVKPHMGTALHPTWLKLSKLLAVEQPKNYAAIGCLVGSMEYVALKLGWRPKAITFFDLDIAAYNPNRDTGASAYANICATNKGAFNGEFTYCRTDSKTTDAIRALGDFDFLLIDGEHSCEALRKDLESSLKACHTGSIVAVHDMELGNGELGDEFRQFVKVCDLPHAILPSSVIVHGLGLYKV